MKNQSYFQKGFARVSILVVSFITLAILSGWMWMNMERIALVPSAVPSGVEDNMIDDNAEWKVYTNEEFGFTIQYPNSEGWGIFMNTNPSLSNKNEGKFYFTVATHEEVSKIKGDSDVTSDSTMYSRCVSAGANSNDTDWVKTELESELLDYVPILVTYSAIKGGYDCEFYWSKRASKDNADLFLKVLESFRFTDSNLESSNWKTYRNEEYGFEFQYKNDWVIEERQDGTFFKLSIIPPGSIATRFLISIREGVLDDYRRSGGPCTDSKDVIFGVQKTPALERGCGDMGSSQNSYFMRLNDDKIITVSFSSDHSIDGVSDLSQEEINLFSNSFKFTN